LKVLGLFREDTTEVGVKGLGSVLGFLAHAHCLSEIGGPLGKEPDGESRRETLL
jgi:hypothetical protein